MDSLERKRRKAVRKGFRQRLTRKFRLELISEDELRSVFFRMVSADNFAFSAFTSSLRAFSSSLDFIIVSSFIIQNILILIIEKLFRLRI